MTKKDYVAFAEELKLLALAAPGEAPELATHRLTVSQEAARRIADLCQTDNPRFNREQFLAATGLWV